MQACSWLSTAGRNLNGDKCARTQWEVKSRLKLQTCWLKKSEQKFTFPLELSWDVHALLFSYLLPLPISCLPLLLFDFILGLVLVAASEFL